MYKYFIFIALLVCFSACKTKQSKNFETAKDSSIKSKKQELSSTSVLDTTIMLGNIKNSNYKGSELNDSLAKNVLYDHFVSRGYWTVDNLPNVSSMTKENKKKLCVEFTSIFKINLNNNNFSDAVVTYWLTPPHAVGNCWEPHKAIISDTDTGYKLSNEEFIPDNFAIDSVKANNDRIIIYGYEYECADHKILKNLRVRLTK